MKNYLLISALLLCFMSAIGQGKNYKYGITTGAYIQHYNGNLGNSFFKFNTACFGGAVANFGVYLNRSFDFNLSASIGDFGYCKADADARRVVSEALRCPGCKDLLGMGQLRSRMISGNIAIKYKFANDILLKESSKFSPYIYLGIGINHLSDNMQRQCVNVGYHFSTNAGAGIKYNISERFNIGYNLGVGYFMTKKVYATIPTAETEMSLDEDEIKMEKRKDLYLQNTITLGININ